MIRWSRLSTLTLAALALTGAGDGRDEPAAYRLRARVTAAAGASIQRLDLPAAVLAALQRADGRDVRLFDAHGARLAMARAEPVAGPNRAIPLPVLPIVGGAQSVAVTGMSLRLDDAGAAHLAQVDGAVRDAGGTTVLGSLLDARRLDGAARALVVEVALPAAQPVTLAVEASDDLKTWRPVAEQVAYHATTTPAPETVALAGLPLARTWLRVSWRGATRLVAPVVVRRATLTVVASGSAMPPPTITMPLARPRDAHAIDLALPFATPLTGMTLVPAGDAIVPVRIFGRDDAEQPWTPLGEGVAARVGGAARGGTIALDGATPQLLRIEADARTDGFVDAPMLTLRFAPAGIVFAAGAPPMTLAAGRADAADRFLPLASITGGAPPVAGGLPTARLEAIAPPALDLAPDRAGFPPGRLALWAVLLAATGLLGWMAWRLASAPAPREP